MRSLICNVLGTSKLRKHEINDKKNPFKSDFMPH